MNHTPGPWKYIPSVVELGTAHEPPFIQDPEVELGDGSRWIVGTDADACLIAAAPDLLESARDALIVLVRMGNQLNWDGIIADQETSDTINSIKAAIAKAEGVTL